MSNRLESNLFKLVLCAVFILRRDGRVVECGGLENR
jgi:hypothetical protein